MLLNLEYFRLTVKSLKLFHYSNLAIEQIIVPYRFQRVSQEFLKIFDIFAFFQKDSVLTKTQCGFQNNKSTTHAILDVLNNIYDNIENSKCTVLILFDFKKAFDTVRHFI